MKGIHLPLQFRKVPVQGAIIVTVPGWDGVIEVISRDQLAGYLSLRHGERVGTYVVWGEDDEGPYAYVGSGMLAARLTRHLSDQSKEGFTRAVIIYSPSGWLHSGRAGHLEAALYRAIRDVRQARLLNLQTPSTPKLDGEGDDVAMAFWVGVAVETLKEAGAGVLVERLPKVYAPRPVACTCAGEHLFRLNSTYDAFLIARGDGLSIKAGSLGRMQEGERWAEERGTGYRRRRELLEEGLLRPLADGEYVVATADIPVTSSSQASCVLATQEFAGTTAWRHVVTGETYSEWRTRTAREHEEPEGAAA